MDGAHGGWLPYRVVRVFVDLICRGKSMSPLFGTKSSSTVGVVAGWEID